MIKCIFGTYLRFMKGHMKLGSELNQFKKGLLHGIPIALGYLSVSFGFGISAVRAGLTAAEAVGISVTNLTSAGQAAGVAVIAAGGSLLEIALTQLIINLRYALMGISLSQRLDKSYSIPDRLITSFGITDEIFAVASAQPNKLKPPYMYGLILISFIGWGFGTFLGAYSGNILPASIVNAMGIMLYGMFLAIIIPPMRKEKSILLAVTVSAALSIIFRYFIPAVSGGFAVIICASAAAAVAAVLFPSEDDQ